MTQLSGVAAAESGPMNRDPAMGGGNRRRP